MFKVIRKETAKSFCCWSNFDRVVEDIAYCRTDHFDMEEWVFDTQEEADRFGESKHWEARLEYGSGSSKSLVLSSYYLEQTYTDEFNDEVSEYMGTYSYPNVQELHDAILGSDPEEDDEE